MRAWGGTAAGRPATIRPRQPRQPGATDPDRGASVDRPRLTRTARPERARQWVAGEADRAAAVDRPRPKPARRSREAAGRRAAAAAQRAAATARGTGPREAAAMNRRWTPGPRDLLARCAPTHRSRAARQGVP